MNHFEAPDTIGICVVYTPYDSGIEDETEAYKQYLAQLEREFGVQFEEVDVHPGASVPAFLVTITENIVPLVPWLMAVFFSAKPVRDNLEVWLDLAKRIGRYFSREVVLNRNGAAVLAVESIFKDMGGIPKQVSLIGYRPIHKYFDEDKSESASVPEIGDAPSTEYLSVTIHAFEIEADGVKFRALVDGKSVKLERL